MTDDASAPGSRLTEAFQRLASDLLSLEINTIVKDNIMGTVMPRMGHALLDILKDYSAELTRIESQLPRLPVALARPRLEAANIDAFDQLREWASGLTKSAHWAATGTEHSANSLMLCRIRDNSDEIKDILDRVAKRGNERPDFERSRVAPLNLLAEEALAIRKIWEIGTETIEMQTVIQLDGDVVTRIRPARARLENDPLFIIHNSAVSTSVGAWTRLVGALEAFAQTIVSGFFSGRAPNK